MTRFLAAVAGLALLASPASAHTMLKTSLPRDGATVAAPKQVMLEFPQKVRLTSVKLAHKGKDVPVQLARGAEAARFLVPVKVTNSGTYQLRWTAMARDGHVMAGKLSFTVRPPQSKPSL